MKIRINNLNLNQIANSGQCFRWKELDDGSFIIPAFGKAIKITQCNDEITLSCDKSDWDNIWKSYFDFERDYLDIENRIINGNDEHLKKAFSFGSGIRILKQDVWEMIFSFMVSQNNNIKRISKSLEMLCEYCGFKSNGEDAFRFPTAHEIPLEIFDDSSFGFGYRAPYLKEMVIFVREHPDYISKLKGMNYDEAFASLINHKGIGTKVANCICLFGLSHVNAFPIDTHVRKLLDKHYPGGINLDNYKDDAGIIQQYLFYYDLKGE